MIIINSQKIEELKTNNIMNISHKVHKHQHYFFITPKMGFVLYDCSVDFVNKEYCVLKFDKVKYINAKIMIDNIQKSLMEYMNENYNDIKNSAFYDIIYTKKDSYMIKVKGNTYNLQTNQRLENVKIQINNIWYDEHKKQGGYNLLLM